MKKDLLSLTTMNSDSMTLSLHRHVFLKLSKVVAVDCVVLRSTKKQELIDSVSTVSFF